MYSNAIILTIFVFALFTIVEMPNIFENVLAQQQPGGSQQQGDSSNGPEKPETEDPTSHKDRTLDDQRRSSSERDNQDSDEDSIRDLNRIVRDIDRTSQEEKDEDE